MKDQVQTAVILAAGEGKRIRNIVSDRPKGFIQLGILPIIEESIIKLLNENIKKIIIITGYRDNFYEQLKSKYAVIQTIRNSKYDESGSLFSLYCGRDLINGDFLLLESDIIYESRAVAELVHHPQKDVVLISGFNNLGDEVYVQTDNGRLVNMSKDKEKLDNTEGEMVGITKISFDSFRELIKFTKREFQKTLLLNYETDGLVALSKSKPVFCHKIVDLKWSEIDNEAHYQYVRDVLYQQISCGKG